MSSVVSAQKLKGFLDTLEMRVNVTTETEEVKESRDTVLDLKFWSMKNNLVFSGP